MVMPVADVTIVVLPRLVTDVTYTVSVAAPAVYSMLPPTISPHEFLVSVVGWAYNYSMTSALPNGVNLEKGVVSDKTVSSALCSYFSLSSNWAHLPGAG
jgi:hypothetical protein